MFYAIPIMEYFRRFYIWTSGGSRGGGGGGARARAPPFKKGGPIFVEFCSYKYVWSIFIDVTGPIYFVHVCIYISMCVILFEFFNPIMFLMFCELMY